jgi:Flp pilus assembly protein TadD
MRLLTLPLLLVAGLAGCSTATPELMAAQQLCAEVENGKSSAEILQACTKVIEESGERRQIALALNRRGSLHRRTGRDEEALEDYSEAARLEPYFTGAYNNRGNIYSARGDDVRAEQSFLAALRADPKNAKAHNNYAWHLATRWQYEEALKRVNEAMALQPDSNVIYDTKAHVLMGLGKVAEAEATFAKAIDLGGVEVVRQYQTALVEKGYAPGHSDGVMDEATKAALSACIRDNCRLLLD